MNTNLRRYLTSLVLITSLTLSSSCLAVTKSTSNAKDTSDPKTNANLLQLKGAILLSIYGSCITNWLKAQDDGLNDTASNMLLKLCLMNGFETLQKQEFFK